ncbi:VanW family protein [Intestinibacillus massiliensis]|nr:VanW family protein [Intestinibacillus massiliensis]
MIKTTALLLVFAGALSMTPAQAVDVDAIPSEIVQAVDAVQDEINTVTTPEPEPEPEPEPQPQPEPVPEPAKPVIQPYATTLGTYTTSYNPRQTNRNTNIRLAASAISGTVLQPGEVFDFNKVVGQRTEAKGYKVATVYSGGEAVDGIGGGICQVSSTLFNAALLANMQITTRSSHGLRVHYLPAGRDATVSWGGPEFRFKNSNSYPVKITASYDSAKGKLTFHILGPSNATPPQTKIAVSKSGDGYITKRYMNGEVNYTTRSYYKD